MRGSVMRQLILKDWPLYRTQIVLTIAAGAIALWVKSDPVIWMRSQS